jgi:hypothetical protein
MSCFRLRYGKCIIEVNRNYSNKIRRRYEDGLDEAMLFPELSLVVDM